MKKIIALVLVLALALSLAACGGSGSKETKVSVFWYEESDVYLSSVRTALNKELDALGVAYDNQYAGNDQSKQLDQIKTAIAGGANLLVVNQVTSGAADTAEDILAAAGDIPVIFFNRAIGTDGSDLPVLNAHANACFIGTDAPEAGHMQGKMIGNYLLENYDSVDLNGDGVIQYAMFKGDAANVEAIYRTQYGVEDCDAVLTAAGKPALEYFDSANSDKFQCDLQGNWSAQAALEYMQTNLSQFNEGNGNMIELIICNNDNMAEGCISALNAAGYNDGTGKTIPVFGVDATDSAKELIAAGKMTGTIKQDAQGMADCISALTSNVASGKDLLADTDSYTKDTANNLNNKIYIAYQEYAG